MERPTCWTCPHWKGAFMKAKGEAEGKAFIGEMDFEDCRRLPPTLPTPDYLAWDRESGASVFAFDGVWPSTKGADFCGEHPSFPAYIASLQVQDDFRNWKVPIK